MPGNPIRDGLNWYVCCANNPLIFTDPSGLEGDYNGSEQDGESIFDWEDYHDLDNDNWYDSYDFDEVGPQLNSESFNSDFTLHGDDIEIINSELTFFEKLLANPIIAAEVFFKGAILREPYSVVGHDGKYYFAHDMRESFV